METDEIICGRQPGPRRTLLYGDPGIGKSTFFSMWEGSVFIPTEDGTGDIECKRLRFCRTLEDVLERLSWLYTREHEFRLVVIDTLDWLEKLIHAEVCRTHNVASITEIKFQEGFAFALPYWKEILDGLTALRATRGMAVGLIAHTKIEKFKDPRTESYDHFTPGVHKLAAAMIQEWCDEVFFATQKIYIAKTDEGFGRKKATGTGSDERVIFTTNRPSYVAKNRLNLPHEMPLDYRVYAQYRDASVAGSVVCAAA